MDKIAGMQRLDIGQLQQNNPLLRRHAGTGISETTKSFSETLKVAVQDVDTLQRVSDKKMEMLASGKDVDIHGTMLALQEADISIRTMGAFKDKITEAYKALINMSI
jgi:flagellar hook-basal body complex protein FliE